MKLKKRKIKTRKEEEGLQRSTKEEETTADSEAVRVATLTIIVSTS